MRKQLKVIPALLAACLMILPQTAFADINDQITPAIIDRARTGSITIDYRDADGENPVEGAEFTFYKVAEGVPELSDSGNMSSVGFPAESIIPGLVIDSETNPVEIEETVRSAYQNASVTGGSLYTLTTNDDGMGKVSGMELGIYLGVETQPAEHYAASIPFLAEVPETIYNDKGDWDAWNYDLMVCPKVLPLGSLKVEKTLKGSDVEKDREWTFTIQIDTASADANPDDTKRVHNTILPEKSGFHTNSISDGSDYGETYDRASTKYDWKKSDGETGSISSGETITLKGGESVQIDGIPIGSVYRVTEKEANKDGYQTYEDAASGNIEQHDIKTASFVNERNIDRKGNDMSTYDWPVDPRYLIGIGISIFLILLAVFGKRRKKDEEAKQ